MRRAAYATYLVLAGVGALAPLLAVLPWLAAGELDVPLLAAGLVDLFADPVSAGFAVDLLLTAGIVILFVLIEGRRVGVRARWLPIALVVLVGVCCGLPAFLAMRERALARGAGTQAG